MLVVFQEHFRHDAPADDLLRLVQDAVSVDVEPLANAWTNEQMNNARCDEESESDDDDSNGDEMAVFVAMMILG